MSRKALLIFLVPCVQITFGQSYDSLLLQKPSPVAGDVIILAQDNLASHIDSVEQRALHSIDSGIHVLNKKIDSLNATSVSPEVYVRSLSRLYEKFDSTLSSYSNSKGDTILHIVNEKINHVERYLRERKHVIDSILSLNDFTSWQKSGLNAKLPDQGIGSLPTSLSMPSADLSGISDMNLPSVQVPEQIDEAINQIDDVSLKAGGLGGELGSVSQRDLTNIDHVKKRIEGQMGRIDELKEINNSRKSTEKLQKELEGVADKMQDEEKLKEEIAGRAKKEFVDHFAGHEDKIDAEIKSLEKLQRKYHSVTDVRYLPKRRTNPEKGKPIVERLILGTSFQVDHSDRKWTGLDVSPYVGYNFSDRLRIAAGGTYRVTFDMKTFEINRANKVFGYRGFANYQVFKGWYAHLEGESLKMVIPQKFASSPSRITEPVWIPSAYVGLFKSFTFGRHFQGQSQILYDFLNVERNYNFKKVVLRFGVEYKIIKKKKDK